jgi:UDP-N-acetylglucosamine:LPS N-acetylglucosamine transferase
LPAASDARPEIFFATIAAGGGHVATARAMAEAIEKLYPGRFTLTVSDYMKEVGVAEFDRRHKDSWRLALRYPALARTGQWLMDAFPRLTVAAQRRLTTEFARAAAADLGGRRPLLVVSNHGLLTAGLSVARRRFGLEVPVLTFATEPHHIGAYWADPLADHIVVPTGETRERLVRFGVPREKVSLAGYPVRRDFLEAPPKQEARARLGLQDRFTCLATFGGEGVSGRAGQTVRALLDSGAGPQVVAVTGRNEDLKEELDGLRNGNGRLRVEGFVEDVASYLAASDVVVGKAGPASVYEALAVGRPVLITGYAALNERGVMRFVEERGLGRRVGSVAELSDAVRDYASDGALLEEVARRCARLDLSSETERLARFVVRYAMDGRAS